MITHITDREAVIGALSIFFASLSLFATGLTLVLIWIEKRWNGYLMILSAMSCCQVRFRFYFSFLLFEFMASVFPDNLRRGVPSVLQHTFFDRRKRNRAIYQNV